MDTGGQKSKQEKKDAHKAKRRAKKGTEAAEASSLSKEAPSAEALAAVGASQMSQAAAERQAQIDQKKVAWQLRTQAGAPAATPGDASGPPQQIGDHAAPSQQVGDDTAAPRGSEEDGSAEDASSSSSEAEEDGEVDVANNAQVRHGRDCWIIKLLSAVAHHAGWEGNLVTCFGTQVPRMVAMLVPAAITFLDCCSTLSHI